MAPETFDYSYFDERGNKDGYGGYNEGTVEGGWDTHKDLARHVLEILAPTPIRSVVEFGAAKGYLVRAFRQIGIADVSGFDVSKYAIDHSEGDVEFYNVLDFPADVGAWAKADLCICIGVLAYVDSEVAGEILRAFSGKFSYLYFYATTEEDLDAMKARGFTDSRVVNAAPEYWWKNVLRLTGWRHVCGKLYTSSKT